MTDADWQRNLSQIDKYYQSLVDQYGNDPRAADYGRPQSQAAKFRMLSEVMPLGGLRVLDVGCGLAHFSGFLKQRWGEVDYHGIDTTAKMVELARSLHPDLKIEHADVLSFEPLESFDVVFANGIFYLIQDQPFQRMCEIIRKMFSLARKAVAFNSLSIWAPHKEPSEFYADPVETLRFCRELSNLVALRHDYLPHRLHRVPLQAAHVIVSVNQPAYLPWLGYFDRIAASDLHVVLDNVQFEKNSFVNRNRIMTARGPTWLTVPVQTSGKFGALPINELLIADDPRWAVKHAQNSCPGLRQSTIFLRASGLLCRHLST